ncbi:hypothetical protein ATANTOWER_027630 [Ataeniobius toweri]|uniref:Uncharacterized protein n=1 Tax=Ataeniobius toweri TaxID=208326 RepID=A0ABU7A8B6_9TELE|nr:hypothetical protein [Ataeniobius toweri]
MRSQVAVNWSLVREGVRIREGGLGSDGELEENPVHTSNLRRSTKQGSKVTRTHGGAQRRGAETTGTQASGAETAGTFWRGHGDLQRSPGDLRRSRGDL